MELWLFRTRLLLKRVSVPQVRHRKRRLHRPDGAEADDGEAGSSSDAPGPEEHDQGGGRGPGQQAELQRGECPPQGVYQEEVEELLLEATAPPGGHSSSWRPQLLLLLLEATAPLTQTFLQFLLIFRRAAAGELQEESGLMALARLSEINVSAEGVMGAKDFFEAKVPDWTRLNSSGPECTLVVLNQLNMSPEGR